MKNYKESETNLMYRKRDSLTLKVNWRK